MPGALAGLVIGLAVLVLGAESLVRGSTRLAAALGVSTLFIGLTLVAYGTSAPELVVSAVASARGLPGVAIGNAVGSNIFNTGVVLGTAALIAPVACRSSLVRREVMVVIATTLVLLLVVAWGGQLSRIEAGAFLAVLIGMTAWAYRQARRVGKDNRVNGSNPKRAQGLLAGSKNLGLTVLGLGLLVIGARWVVNGAVAMAETLGVSEAFIGLTIVAAGTSLPELATSAVAAVRGQSDIAIGNVLGSNIFNMLGILGIAGVLRPLPVPRQIIVFDLPVALLFALACIPIGLTGRRIARGEGAILLLGYVVYCSILVLKATSPG